MANETQTLIQKIALTSMVTSVSFANIPQNFTDLKIVLSARSTANTGYSGNYDQILWRFNGSTSGYTSRQLYANGATAYSATSTVNTSALASGSWGVLTQSGISDSGATANTFSSCDMYIPNYTSGNNKSISWDIVEENNITAAWREMGAMLWSNTGPINNVSFALTAGAFDVYSSFSLYGIAKAE